jgi:hypothetical protein
MLHLEQLRTSIRNFLNRMPQIRVFIKAARHLTEQPCSLVQPSRLTTTRWSDR